MNRDWNVSKLQVLRQCLRKFFFIYEIADHHFTFPYRRKAWELSKMKTLKMWEGSLIDWVVTHEIIPLYQSGRQPDYQKIADDAVALAKRQFDFSANGWYHREDISRTDAGPDWMLLDIHECNLPFEEKEIIAIYDRIYKIILDFPDYSSPVKNQTLDQYLITSKFLRPDTRKFKFSYGDVKIQPQIDLVRYLGKSIHVIDWKVSERDEADYSRQLILAGVVAMHFAKEWYKDKGWSPVPQLEDIRLFEINLLNGTVKNHPFTKNSTAQALDSVFLLSDEQEQLSQNKSWDLLDIEDYQRTDKSETCMTCKMKPVCKHILLNNLEYNEDEYVKLVQHRELA